MSTAPHTLIFFLGNHALLAASEVWKILQSVDPQAGLSKLDRGFLRATSHSAPSDFPFSTIGGCDRLGVLLETLAEPVTPQEILKHIPAHTSTKIKIGLSGLDVSTKELQTLGMQVKKLAREQGTRVQFITSTKVSQLKTAQVLFNELTY